MAHRLSRPELTEPFFKTPKPKKSNRQKQPRRPRSASKQARLSKAHLKKLRQLPCCACDRDPSGTVHHILRTGDRGMGMRSSDKWGLPLCDECHTHGPDCLHSSQSEPETAWFNSRRIDPIVLAATLWTLNKIDEPLDTMRRAIISHREKF